MVSSLRTLLVATSATIAAQAAPQPYANKYYEYVHERLSFADAKAAAEARMWNGKQGTRLRTISELHLPVRLEIFLLVLPRPACQRRHVWGKE